MIVNDKNITKYIPQRPPMVMISELISSEENKTITSLRISPENIFFQEGYLREAGLVENIAQTAAAGIGYRYSLEGKTPPPGFIGGIRRLKIGPLPEAGDDIITEVTVDHVIMNASVITGKISNKGTLIAACEMKIFLLLNE